MAVAVLAFGLAGLKEHIKGTSKNLSFPRKRESSLLI
jgi:hypothetical protein